LTIYRYSGIEGRKEDRGREGEGEKEGKTGS
jgi:hypothetical protein